MDPALQQETERLARSWMRHEAGVLRDYLVAGVEDPRLNVQSVLSRHFILRALFGERFNALMEQEYRFAAAMNWLTQLGERLRDAGELALVLHALRRGSDNAEGIEIPHFLLDTFSALPAAVGSMEVPNYVDRFLSSPPPADGQSSLHQPGLDTFCLLWNRVLVTQSASPPSSTLSSQPPSVLEPACGSANDYRFLHAYGLSRLVNYTGVDLCAKNIENAQGLFPGARFEVGSVFDIAAADKAYDLCFLHDLFEHLSPAGIEAAVQELCRVVRAGLCVGFFNMDEVPDHLIRPVDEYHWNLLSMARMKESFARCGFTAQVLHLGSFLRQRTGCEQTHNPNAYTFLLHPAGA
jgi:SAM-dependent methyltransferase